MCACVNDALRAQTQTAQSAGPNSLFAPTDKEVVFLFFSKTWLLDRFLFAFDRRSPKRLFKNQAGQNVVLHIRELVTISSDLQMEKGRFSDFVYELA
ncbi:hypothetical protein GOODEAATRI_001280 [Goodea atripinnis]|uniref:Uncharacterized protein n=1 Tax=Goodea atripinnis TaxID=208336 RepID=A0ABV0MXR7_9TELE